jgi:hypothetical protein
MKQLGNLAIICAVRHDTLLQILNGVATVHIGHGPAKETFTMGWHDDEKISELIRELNHGRLSEENLKGEIAA